MRSCSFEFLFFLWELFVFSLGVLFLWELFFSNTSDGQEYKRQYSWECFAQPYYTAKEALIGPNRRSKAYF